MRNYGTSIMQQLNNSKFLVTQGFIGKSPSGATTTLGREGSDYSAALACANAQEVVIWKDVQGMHNADPRIFKETVTMTNLIITKRRASYYGASVIHPRTVKPLQNRNIPLM